ncbi:hypothetical protein GCM10009069_29010 [Algimonas arctica]|uniref:Uncharacterized protein n=1 Tax=Algimonas arctica TaxID=1479486 RepID=A0A8J3CUQ6_9PROT|nr:hypothetical protein [Algimonas arctica]GHB04605.1 hypothetical protein GCM10009069_29010 [Algimonas arctica]
MRWGVMLATGIALCLPHDGFAQASDDTLSTPEERKPIDVRRSPESIPGRRRPRPVEALPERVRLFDPMAVPSPQSFDPSDVFIPVPDRWRLIENLGVNEKWWDPYNQNTLKGDRPLPGTKDWFFVATAVSDTVLEPRNFPIPVGVQTTEEPSLDLFGDPDSLVFSQTFIASGALIKGNTVFKPQDYEYRLTLALNINHVTVEERRILFVEPSKGTERTDAFLGVQEAFFDYHIRNVSERYDFDSLRVGIQPFSSDFRGFLFQDLQPGIRFFGNRDNNRWQYNLAVFGRLEKDTNSGLNSIVDTPRDDYILLANAYRQDFPIPALTSQVTAVLNINREGDSVEIDDNGFPVRPALLGDLRGRDYDVLYLGYNADGRIGRINVTGSTYLAIGEDRNSIFTNEPTTIMAGFGAVEASYDYDWVRVRLSGLYATGDSDPYDDIETGFDSIFENPQFAGADTSYWVRQNVPFIGGGRAIGLSGRNGILNSLRSSKEQGQSNFNNPGTMLIGVGADLDILPELRVSLNANYLAFAQTEILQTARQQANIARGIGFDLSASAIYRPKFTQNIVFRGSVASLEPTGGFRQLFDNNRDRSRYLSVLLNATLSY